MMYLFQFFSVFVRQGFIRATTGCLKPLSKTWVSDKIRWIRAGLRQSPRTLSGRVRSGPCSGSLHLHDALFLTLVSVTKSIGCKAALRALQFVNSSSVQSSSSTVNAA